ncbi:MAG: 4-hydroxythreonine-4-phosphate dehydrogenase PdxA [Limnobacter sp.]|nr:4-hydroxythreonine-4-phosphate dehydrogenase PdxA [Limnobacter sp.]
MSQATPASATAPLLLTAGEPAGIGPELCSLLAESHSNKHGAETPLASKRPLVVLGDAALLEQRCKQAAIQAHWQPVTSLQEAQPERLKPGYVYLWHHPLRQPCITGQPNTANAAYVLDLLHSAVQACLAGQATGLVTAPFKSRPFACGAGFQGHTEYLATLCNTPRVVMMLVGGNLRVALATTHLPLSQVPQALTASSLTETLTILLADLSSKWGIAQPCVRVTGLNPHAGESGTLGLEEQHIIEPVIKHFQALGHHVSGPHPADTLFQPKHLKGADAILAMYHDQGLPVLKYASFGEGVNVTLGLPIVRTSVDHGTALGLAGTRNISLGSLLTAVQLANQLADTSLHRPTHTPPP